MSSTDLDRYLDRLGGEAANDVGSFLDFLHGDRSGIAFLCVGRGPHMVDGKLKHEDFVPLHFQWPTGRAAMIRAAEEAAPTCDVYATVNLFARPRRTAANALPTDVLWGDDVGGAEDDPRVTLVDSGGGKPDELHAYMRLGEAVDAETASALSEAVFSSFGGNPEGFDAARVLRVPGTLNHKLHPPAPVTWAKRSDVVVPLADLPRVEAAPDAEQGTVSPSDDFDPESLPPVPRMRLREEPNEDRSRQVFDFLRECREEGVSDADALAAVLHHRPARARAEERFKSRAKQDAWLLEDGQRILQEKLDAPAQAASERPLPTIVIRPVADFSAEQEESAKPLLGEKGNIVLPAGGESMIYGLPGTNKTTISDDLAFHVAGGHDNWLGIPILKRRRVLLIENEGPRALRRERLQERLNGCLLHKPGDYLQVWEQPWAAIRLPDARWRQTLAEQVAALEIDLVVIGPVRSLGMTGHGALPEIEEFVQHFQDVREQSGRDVGFLVVHHENRGGSVSGVWEGAVESLFHAQGRGHGRARLFFQKCRWSSDYHQTAKDLAWSSDVPYSFDVVEKAAPTTSDEMEGLIVDAVRNMPGTSWTPILNGLPGTKAQRVDARDALLTEGRIVNLVEGENDTRVVLRSVQQGHPAKLYLPDDPAVAEEVEWKW